MKEKHLLWAVVILLVTNVVAVIGWNKSMNDVQAYHQYYMGAEELLDTLENHYNWIDAIDNENYYDGVAKLHLNK